MNIEITEIALDEYAYWIDNDEFVVSNIMDLFKAIIKGRCKGIGKTAPLNSA
jgi:Txe/YoeB family toxin of Txe-Axe toxin-antitoxin module